MSKTFSPKFRSNILDIISNVGYVLDDVIELKSKDGLPDTNIAKMLCSTIRQCCKTPHIKSAIKALQSIGRGQKYCQNFAQPIVGQISNSAAKTIKEECGLAIHFLCFRRFFGFFLNNRHNRRKMVYREKIQF